VRSLVDGIRVLLRAPWLAPLVVVALVGGDLVFAALNLFAVDASGHIVLPRVLQVNAEWTAPEIIQYGKWMVVALALAAVHRITRERSYLPWAFAFAYAGIDDATALHERIGRFLSAVVARLTGVEVRSGFFELLWIGAVVLVFLLVLRRASGGGTPQGDAVRYTRRAAALAGLYALFAVGLDAVQTAYGAVAPSDRRGETLLGIAENSGELVSLSLIVGLTLREGGRAVRRSSVRGASVPETI
jgi:hypothetical protein